MKIVTSPRRGLRLALAGALIVLCAAAAGLSRARYSEQMPRLIQTQVMPSGARPELVCDVVLEGEGWTVQDGLLFRVEGKRIPDGQFYTLEKNGLSPAATHRLCQSGQFEGHSYELDILWAQGAEGVVCWDNAQPGSMFWFTRKVYSVPIPGQRKTAALTWYLGDRRIPMLIQLETGKMTDPLARFDQEERESLRIIQYFPDLKHALASRQGDDLAWVLDLEVGTSTSLPEEIPMSCSGFWISDANTLTAGLLYPDLRMDVWTYDVGSGVALRTVEGEAVVPYKAEGRYGLAMEEDGSLTAVDLCTGVHAPVENFTYGWGPRCEYGRFLSDPSNRRLLYLRGAPKGMEPRRVPAEPGLGQLGILDPCSGSFVLWEMEDREDLYWEEGAGWLDEKRVFLWSTERAGESGVEDRRRIRVYSV